VAKQERRLCIVCRDTSNIVWRRPTKLPSYDKNGLLTSSTIARSNFADPDNVNAAVGVDKDGKRDITIAQGDKPITKYTVCFDIFTIMFFNIPNPKGFIV
jgi:hypothetical protein